MTKVGERVPSGGAKYIRWFSELGSADVASVGGKNASLGPVGGLGGQGSLTLGNRR